jgi:hypothetical protein
MWSLNSDQDDVVSNFNLHIDQLGPPSMVSQGSEEVDDNIPLDRLDGASRQMPCCMEPRPTSIASRGLGRSESQSVWYCPARSLAVAGANGSKPALGFHADRRGQANHAVLKLLRSVHFLLGNSKKILFWTNPWLDGNRLSELAPVVVNAVPVRHRKQGTVA